MSDPISSMAQPLRGLSAVQVGDGVAAGYCGRLLWDLGADVLQVTQPRTDPAQVEGLAAQGSEVLSERASPRGLRSGGDLLLYLDHGKRHMPVDIDTTAGRVDLEGLLASADLLIEDLSERERERLDLTPEALAKRHPRLIAVSVTPFGRGSPRSDWRTSAIVDWAMGGYMYFGGDPDREPLMVPGEQAGFHGGIQAAIAALAALYERTTSHLGQGIEVSVQEATLSAHAWLSVMWSHEGKIQGRDATDLTRCRDGWVHFMAPVMHDDLFSLIGRPDLLEQRPPSTSLEQRLAFSARLQPEIAAWAASRTKQEIFETAQLLRVPVAPVNTVADLLADRHLLARQFFRPLSLPDGRTLTLPGLPYRLMQAGGDEGTDDRRQRTGGVPAALPSAPRQMPSGPLGGIRVIEVTANWAGPLAARHLADLGAEVIKVESPRRPATRAAHYAGDQTWTRPYNRAGYFNKLNRNKCAITLDLSLPAGRTALLRLVRTADVLIENNSARVMGNLGLDYATLAAENPRLVMLSISGYGASGPYRDHVAYGSNTEAACGLASLMGYSPDEPRRTSSFYADPVAAGHGAVAVLAALLAGQRSGSGMSIDVSLQESAICLFGEAFVEHGLTGATPLARGNRSATAAPQGCYPSAGQDCWLALSVPDDATWQALCHALGRDDWLNRHGLDSLAGRRAAHSELDAGIGAWTRLRDHQEAARLLQAAGVPAGPVLINWELLSDPHLYARGFYVPIKHSDVGVFPYPGLAWRLARTPATIRAPAPRFAEHNEAVLRDLLGCDQPEIDLLYEQGVAASAPR